MAQVISILQEGFRHRKKAYSKYFSNFNTDVDYPSNTQWYCIPLLKHLITHDLSHTDNILEKCWAGKLLPLRRTPRKFSSVNNTASLTFSFIDVAAGLKFSLCVYEHSEIRFCHVKEVVFQLH